MAPVYERRCTRKLTLTHRLNEVSASVRLVHFLDQLVASTVSRKTELLFEVGEDLEASLYLVLAGHFRQATSLLRFACENSLLDIYLRLRTRYEEWKRGDLFSVLLSVDHQDFVKLSHATDRGKFFGGLASISVRHRAKERRSREGNWRPTVARVAEGGSSFSISLEPAASKKLSGPIFPIGCWPCCTLFAICGLRSDLTAIAHA
jgi:hypothetical protein